MPKFQIGDLVYSKSSYYPGLNIILYCYEEFGLEVHVCLVTIYNIINMTFHQYIEGHQFEIYK